MHSNNNEAGFSLIGIIVIIILLAATVFAYTSLRGGSDDTETRGQDAIQQAKDLSDQIKAR